MTYTTWKIERTPVLENGGWDTPNTEEITRFNDPILNLALGESRDSFSFSSVNFNEEYSNKFKSNDLITVYRVTDSVTITTDDIKMTATIKKVPNTRSSKSSTVRVDGFNLSESILSSIVFVDFSTGKTIPDAIQEAIDNAGNTNENFKVTWDSGNPSLKQDNSAFPTVYDKWFNKPLRQIIEKYSVDSRTDDGDYFWYVDRDNKLIWRPKSNATESFFSDTIHDVLEIKSDKDINDVRNFFILKGGLGPNNKQIQTRAQDWTSIAKHGMRYKLVISEVNQAKNLVGDDILKSYGTDQSPDGYPVLSTLFETSWVANYTYTTNVYGISVVKGSVVEINKGSETLNKKAYNEVIRTEITKRLQQQGEDLKTLYGKGKKVVDILSMSGQFNWSLGSLIDVTIEDYGNTTTSLRVNQIQYTTETDLFSLEEDTGSI